MPVIEVTDEDRTGAFEDSAEGINIQIDKNNLLTPRNNTATSNTVAGR